MTWKEKINNVSVRVTMVNKILLQHKNCNRQHALVCSIAHSQNQC